MKKHCFTLDLRDDLKLIAEYEYWHKNVWPEIVASIKDAGIEKLEIYRFQTRLMMIMEVNDHFSFEKKAKMDAENNKVQEWETLMWKYQQSLPNQQDGVKWVRMDKIFDLQ